MMKRRGCLFLGLSAVAILVAGCQSGSPTRPLDERTGRSEAAIVDSEVRVENFDDYDDITVLTDPDFGRLAFALDDRPGLWLRNQLPATSNAPLWGQVLANTDIYNIRDFGADPTGSADSAPAIIAAITAARADGAPGGVVYFPAGEYRTLSTIWLPRDPLVEQGGGLSWKPFVPLSLVGAGVGATSVRHEGETAGTGAFMSESVSDVTARPTTGYRFERMSISSTNAGTYAFAFTQQYDENAQDDPTPSTPPANDRAMYFAFRDIRFHAPNQGNDPVVYIRGGFNGSMENVIISGDGSGGVGLHLHNSVQWSLRDIQVVFQDGDLWKAILIEGGGQHILHNIRINATAPLGSGSSSVAGVGLHLKSTQTLDVSTVVGEGFQGEHFVHIEDSSDIHFKNLVTPSPKGYIATELPYYGVYIDGDTRNVRWSGGGIGSVELVGGGHAPGAAIAIEDGAQDIRLEDVTYLGSDDESLEEPTTFDIPSSIRLEARVFDSSGNLWTKVRGATSAQGLLGNEIDARGLRVATIAMPPVDTIVLDKIVYGSRSDCPEGELLTLIIKNESFPGVNTVLLRSSVPGSNLRLASDWTPTPAPGRAATMQLVCDGSAWYEISRVAEVKGP